VGVELSFPRVAGATLRSWLMSGSSHITILIDMVQRERIRRAAALRELSAYSMSTAAGSP
jgi:hypothetical protein